MRLPLAQQHHLSWALQRCLKTTGQRLHLVALAPESAQLQLGRFQTISTKLFTTADLYELWMTFQPFPLTLRFNWGTAGAGTEAKLWLVPKPRWLDWCRESRLGFNQANSWDWFKHPFLRYIVGHRAVCWSSLSESAGRQDTLQCHLWSPMQYHVCRPEACIQTVTLEKIRTLTPQTFTGTITLGDAARCKFPATVWSCQTIGDRKIARDPVHVWASVHWSSHIEKQSHS